MILIISALVILASIVTGLVVINKALSEKDDWYDILEGKK